jgi:DNA ligase D-like protein (predicted 3'-phosphoesterase)
MFLTKFGLQPARHRPPTTITLLALTTLLLAKGLAMATATATAKPKKTQKEPIFVIHKHAASHLHYDVRLEVDGALKSWAVPKGPSTDPAQKHLAIQVEDHPLDYATFEGVIAPESYGAGTVMVWDTGTYRNIKTKDGHIVPMDKCLANGRVEVWLDGKKLKGGYALIRTKLQKGEGWLLVKMNDEHANRRHDVLKQDTSAKTGRTMEEIREASS